MDLVSVPSNASKKSKKQLIIPDEDTFNKKLDRTKVNDLMTELEATLSFEDIFEIKKQINHLSKSGKLLSQRIKFMEARNK
jgi:flagellin-specific chaperone FliS